MFEPKKKEPSNKRTTPRVDCPLEGHGKEGLQLPEPTDEASDHLIKKAFIQMLAGYGGPCIVTLNPNIESCLDGSDTTLL